MVRNGGCIGGVFTSSLIKGPLASTYQFKPEKLDAFSVGSSNQIKICCDLRDCTSHSSNSWLD